jgi:methyltransferase (TIGR00027 family)
MTAACRALETERPDGWLKDPFAARLAGERGMAIAKALPSVEVMCFGIGIRSRILDDVIAAEISDRGIATVLCVGAGLDTRPWRLDLPRWLRWIEVDLQPMLDYKWSIMGSEPPVCNLQRLAVDLNDPDQRDAMFAEVADPKALMITEGLLMYLPASTVEALAREAAAEVEYWLLDVASTALSRGVRMDQFRQVEAVRAPDNLDGEGILETLDRTGWTRVAAYTYAVQGMSKMPPGRAEAMAQAHAGSGAPAPGPLPDTDFSGVHLFRPVDYARVIRPKPQPHLQVSLPRSND